MGSLQTTLSIQRLLAFWAVASLSLLLGCGQSGAPTAPTEPAVSSAPPAPGEPQSVVAPPAPRRDQAVRLVFTYGSEKQVWIKELTQEFNQARTRTEGGAIIQVEALPMGSGECIDELLSGTRQAHLTSPASAAFIKLGNAKSRVQTGRDLIGPTENLVLSPVVIAMWKPMAEAIGWGKRPVGWADILALARSGSGWSALNAPQWGSFKFGHTHPEFSNSGLISLFAEVYAAAGKMSGLTLEDLRKPEVRAFVHDIEQAVVHYGDSTGFFGRKMFGNGPGYLSAAVLYENMVIESYSQSPPPDLPVVAIYPKEGTFWSDHPVGIVEREWVTPEHSAAAKKYIAYLLEKRSQERATALGFRPALPDVPLADLFNAAHGVDPKEPKTTLEVPSAEVMEATLQLWREQKKKAHVTLVLDVSGSMKGERIQNARGGALQLLQALGDADSLSFLPFSNNIRFAFEGLGLAAGRDQARQAIEGVFADGGTALYDAVSLAFERQMTLRTQSEQGRIHAVVVLTDGQDTNSKMKFPQLLEQVRGDNETKNVRVFTIGYGSESDAKLLKQIADVTQAKFYEGTPQNIRTVFREISTFF